MIRAQRRAHLAIWVVVAAGLVALLALTAQERQRIAAARDTAIAEGQRR